MKISTEVPSYVVMLQRAQKRLGVLHALTQNYIERQPAALSFECEIETRDHIARFMLLESPPPEIALVVADCVHCMRQTLDHFAYEMAATITNRNPPPNATSAAYPIHNSDRSFFGSLKKKIAPRADIPPKVLAVLEQFQPYKGGHGDKLRALRDLDDLAKHRFPPVVQAIGGSPETFSGGVQIKSSLSPKMGPVEDGAEIHRFTPTDDALMNVGMGFTLDISFPEDGPGQGRIVTQAIKETRDLILRGILRPIESELFGWHPSMS